jgi:hypothetical protein
MKSLQKLETAVRGYIRFEGRWIKWSDLVKLKREQREAQNKAQLTLFELKDDHRPATQTTAAGRYQEPTLFKVD